MAEGVPGAQRSDPGGIVALAGLIDAHRAAFEYDWRARFGLPLNVVGKSMPWGEAVRLTAKLSADPSSWVAASREGWAYPFSREAMVLADLFDLQHKSKTKRGKAKPHPIRPWLQAKLRRLGGARLTKSQLRALLDAHRDDEPMRAEVISDG